MKILYAFQGTGNGHITRAQEIISILQEFGEVDTLISGNEVSLQKNINCTHKLHGLNFIIGKKGGINFLKTILNFRLFNFIKDIKNFPVRNYEVIINDFEPVTAWAAKLKGIEIISLSHQNAVYETCLQHFTKFRLERFILKYYAPSTNLFGFHFSTNQSNIFLPIIKNEIRSITNQNKGHYTVYLPAYKLEKICSILKKIPIVKWQIFSKEVTEIVYKKNMKILPINSFDFNNSMATCTGVLCGAGFETPAEALYLEKKLMVIPMKNQFEQLCNAKSLQGMGVPVIKKLNKKSIKYICKWLADDTIIKVNYPNQTREILETLLLCYQKNQVVSTIVS